MIFAFDVAYNQLTEELNQAESFKRYLREWCRSFSRRVRIRFRCLSKSGNIICLFSFKNDQDTTNTAYQALYARASSLYAQVSEAVSWFDPEVLTLSDEQIWGYFEATEISCLSSLYSKYFR